MKNSLKHIHLKIFFLVFFSGGYTHFCNITFYHFDKEILFCWLILKLFLVIDQAGLLEHYISKEP